jgi:GalNAc5-diNAcBac-PP-undecaprenol beta-1,3-glucosyltransferase
MMPSKVTIIMATYNRVHFIMETLVSVQAQTFLNWECLIIDDGGTDTTEEILTPFIGQDDRFQYLKRPDSYKKGLSGCRNYGLDISKGEFVIFFDDDDVVHPDNLKMSLEVVETNNADFCHYQKMSFVEEKPLIQSNPVTIVKLLSKADIEKIITQEIGLASCTVLWKKQCFDSIRFNESLLYAEEWECYSSIIVENFKGIIINNILYYNRKHSESNTGEFYRNNSIRRESYTKAVLLVVQNLKQKKLLSDFLKRYFVTLSKDFTEYNLFNAILNVLDMPTFEKLKWQLFYMSYPVRLPIYKIKKALQK